MKDISIHSLPTQFVTRLQQIIPAAEFEKCVATFSQPLPTSFRVNTLKTLTENVREKLTEGGFELTPVAWYPTAFTIPTEQKSALTQTTEFLQGSIYIQNLSSLLPVLLLNPQPTDHILDLAAAPGSKTTQMACLMHNQGHIAAVEPVKARFFKLKANLMQQGVSNTQCYQQDGTRVWKYCAEKFDKILLDTPCSTETRFNLFNPETYAFWSEKKILEMSRKQKQLLFSAWHCLKPGGTLIYATCSFAPEENEMVIDRLLQKLGNACQIEPLQLPITNIQPGFTAWKNKRFSAELTKTIRILPNQLMPGFFICKMRKLHSCL